MLITSSLKVTFLWEQLRDFRVSVNKLLCYNIVTGAKTRANSYGPSVVSRPGRSGLWEEGPLDE